MAGAQPSPNRGVMIVLAYLWALAIVPLLVEKQDPEVQWHAKHGLVLMAAELVVIFAYMLITSLVSIAAIGLGCVMSLLFVFAWVGILADRLSESPSTITTPSTIMSMPTMSIPR